MNNIFSAVKPTFKELIDRFQRVVDNVHAGRKIRSPDWFQIEMEGVLRAINWERAQLNKDSLPMRLLLRRETSASGHTDYAHKLAIYAAELVLDEDGGP